MRYVVTVADEGGFQAAAQRLHMAQPPLSRQIKELERQLGVTLFHRRPTRLTEAGEVFVASARRVLADVDLTIQKTSRVGLGRPGSVNIGFTVTTAYDEMPKLQQAVHLHDPEIGIVGHELWDPQLDAALRHQRIDIAVGRGLPLRDGFAVETLRAEPFVIVVHRTHRLADRQTVKLRELRGDVFRLYPRYLAPHHFDFVTGVLAGSGETFEVVENPGPLYRNVGVNQPNQFTLVARSFGRRLPPDLVLLTVEDDLPPAKVELLWRPALASPATHVVVGVARHLSAAGAWD
jgi:DNA-binding transcriptional LysR family regulator